MKNLFFLLVLAAGVWACGGNHTHAEGDDHAHHDHDGHDHAGHDHGDHADVPMTFGEEITSDGAITCLLYTSPSPRDATLSRMPSSA